MTKRSFYEVSVLISLWLLLLVGAYRTGFARGYASGVGDEADYSASQFAANHSRHCRMLQGLRQTKFQRTLALVLCDFPDPSATAAVAGMEAARRVNR